MRVGGQSQIPADVRRRIQRGEDAIRDLESLWEECLAFFDGEHYVGRSAINGRLQSLERLDGGIRKPAWRPRMVRNRYTSALIAEASTITARVPSYECVPLNGDPGPVAGARLGEKALVGLHSQLKIGPRVLEAALLAAATGGGYLWPYWNGLVGRPIPDPQDPTRAIARTGEIGLHVLGQSEVLWEPGVSFEESRWHAVRKAQPVEEVKARADYMGSPDLKADARPARTGAAAGEQAAEELVMVYHYLERPSSRHARGRWLQFAGGQQIAPQDDFPSEVDEPVVLQLPWIPAPHRHRPMGLGEQLLDPQRTYNRTINQIVTWINIALVPQILAPVGSIPNNQQLTDEPGAVIYYRPVGGLVPRFRETPQVPRELFETLDRCIADIEEITGQRDLPKGIEAAAAIQAINERDASRRAMVIRNLASFYSGLGRRLLELVQRHYTEERLLKIQGRFGVELVEGFLGSHVKGVIDVQVSEASIEPRTRAAQEAKILAFADRGWISPHQAMAALNGGTAEQLIDGFELNIAKQHREIRQMVEVGAGGGGGRAPVPEPSLADNHQVHIDVLRQWMLTRDFELEPEQVQEAATLHLEMHEAKLQEAQMDQLAMQDAAARGAGMRNAARPAAVAASPSMPSLATSAGQLGEPIAEAPGAPSTGERDASSMIDAG